ncbi:MAG: hypothetical protein ACFB5Z_14020 [Elainellaceae cyanobacterium]
MESTQLSPVYAIAIVSTVFAVIWGIIFKDMLEYEVNRWYANRETQLSVEYRKPRLVVVYAVLSLLVSAAIGASLGTFGFSPITASLFALGVALPTALLIWLQLGAMFKLLVFGGSEAMDIDSYGAGQKYDAQAIKAQAAQSQATQSQTMKSK